jgi:hypothetical protein
MHKYIMENWRQNLYKKDKKSNILLFLDAEGECNWEDFSDVEGC